MKRIFRILALILLVALAFSIHSFAQPAEQAQQEVSVLFTHDLHARFVPQPAENGGESGGYARLATALETQRQRYPHALTLDGGDFSMGSLFQTLYTQTAADLVMMGRLGYDVTTLGNHEFDFGPQGLAQMLTAAAQGEETVPSIVLANYAPKAENPYKNEVETAMDVYGVRDAIVIEKNGVKIGVFGLMGEDGDACAPESGFVRTDSIQVAKEMVAQLQTQEVDFIVALSHGGTEDNAKKSEDELLAKAVSGIDLIISGHTHTTLEKPIVINDTYIVSSGPYCENLGVISFSLDQTGVKTLKEYTLVPIDETLEDDEEISNQIQQYKDAIAGNYLEHYGYTYDQILVHAPFTLETPDSNVQEPNVLGELIADAYRFMVNQVEGEQQAPLAITVTADGIIRAPLREGEITVSNAFDVLSLGIGPDRTTGYPMVSVWLTGKELRAVMEIDASVSPIMTGAQLFISGAEYEFNTKRILFNKVYQASLLDQQGQREEIDDNKLYRVVTGLYMAQMLSQVESKSFGILPLVPKDENGQPITDMTNFILRDGQGNEVKEWQALAAYLAHFGGEDGTGEIPAQYAQSNGGKIVIASMNPINLLRSLNWIGALAVFLVILLLLIILLLVRVIVKKRRKAKRG